MRPSHILSTALLCTSAAAWPSFRDGSLGVALGELILPHKRAPQAITLGDTAAATPNPTQSIATSATQNTASSSGTARQTAAASNSKQTTGTDSATPTSDSGSSSSNDATPSPTTFDPRLPPGGISMITPNPRSSTQYYKVGNYVTFAWNYTSLSVTPKNIDILATNSRSQATFTIAANQTVSPTGLVVWNTTGNNLITDTYTLVIHDSLVDVTSVPKAGYLGTYSQFTFGMYLPQKYKDLDEWVCVTCSGAFSSLQRNSLLSVVFMAGAAVLGGTWFVGGLSALL